MSEKQEPVPEQKMSTYEAGILIALAILVSFGLLFATGYMQNKTAPRENISREICKNLSLNYSKYDPFTKTIECTLKQVQITEHLNISTANQTIFVQPDWGFYEGKKVE